MQTCLKKGLDFAHTMEEVEEEQAVAAQKKLEEAIQEERDIEESRTPCHKTDASQGPEIMIQRNAQERLDNAKAKEQEAYDEEQRHLDLLEQLHHNEEELKATLDGLKDENRKDEFLRAL